MSAGPDLGDTARLLGAYTWTERRLFEILGGAAAGATQAELTLLLDAVSQQHAWHATLFADRIPAGASLPAPETLVVCPSPAAESVLARLAGATTAVEALAILTRVVLPRLIAGYRLHLEQARPLSDPPVIRAMRLVVRDEDEELADSEALLQKLLAESGDPATAQVEVASAEAAFAGAGPGWVH